MARDAKHSGPGQHRAGKKRERDGKSEDSGARRRPAGAADRRTLGHGGRKTRLRPGKRHPALQTEFVTGRGDRLSCHES